MVNVRGFGVVAVLTLALGIGACTAMFSVVNGVLFRPLPYNDPESVVRIIQNTVEIPPTVVRTAVLDAEYFRAIRARVTNLSAVAGFHSHPNTGSLSVDRLSMTFRTPDETIPLFGTKVSPGLFPMLGSRPHIGRVFGVDEEQPGNSAVVILSYGTWQKHLKGDPAVTRRAITLDNAVYSIVGVMPADYDFPDAETEFWIPLTPADVRNSDGNYEGPGSANLEVIARLKDGVSIDEANAELETIFRQLDDANPQSELLNLRSIPRRSEIVSMKDEMVRAVRPALQMMLAAVLCLLLIGCANIANLMLARTVSRQPEFAIRVALGARHGHLIRQVLGESILLGLAGGVAGTLLAYVGIQFFKVLAAANLPRPGAIRLDPTVLGFAFVLSLLSGVLFGLIPALFVARRQDVDALHGQSRYASSTLASKGLNRSQGALVVAQIMLAVVLLVSAGLFARSFERLTTLNPGFDQRNVLALELTLRPSRHSNTSPFYEDLIARIKSLPNVESAAVASVRDFPMTKLGPFNVQLSPLPVPMDQDFANLRRVSPEYFSVLGTPVIQGRGFDANNRGENPAGVLVNQEFARRYFPGTDPVGRTVDGQMLGRPIFSTAQIIGIVDDIRYYTLDAAPQPEVYLNLAEFPGQNIYQARVAVRMTNDEPASTIRDIRTLLRQLDPEARLDRAEMLADIVGESNALVRHRLNAVLLVTFAVFALALAATGIYAVMAYSVTQRTHEIGVRIALGAQRHEVLQLILSRGIALTSAGMAFGLVAATIVTHLFETLLFGVRPLDPSTFAAVFLVFAVTAVVACCVPARRATKVDPLIALRHE
jgi:putative ABC transport system permease protein